MKTVCGMTLLFCFSNLVFSNIVTGQDLIPFPPKLEVPEEPVDAWRSELAPPVISRIQGDNIQFFSYGSPSSTFTFSSPDMVLNFGTMDAISLTQDPRVIKQLELSKEQESKLKALRTAMNKQMQTIHTEMNAKMRESGPVSHSTLVLKQKKLKEKFVAEIDELLLPFQTRILSNVEFKRTLQYNGLPHTLTQSKFSKVLNTTEKQKQEILKIQREEAEEIQKMMAKIKADSKTKMMNVLSDKQKEKFNSLDGSAEKKKKRD